MIGINIMALAVALSKVSQLGTSPIASIPNVLSEVWKQSIGLYMLLFMLLFDYSTNNNCWSSNK